MDSFTVVVARKLLGTVVVEGRVVEKFDILLEKGTAEQVVAMAFAAPSIARYIRERPVQPMGDPLIQYIEDLVNETPKYEALPGGHYRMLVEAIMVSMAWAVADYRAAVSWKSAAKAVRGEAFGGRRPDRAKEAVDKHIEALRDLTAGLIPEGAAEAAIDACRRELHALIEANAKLGKEPFDKKAFLYHRIKEILETFDIMHDSSDITAIINALPTFKTPTK